MGKWYHLQVGDHFPINHLRTPAAAAARHRFDADLHLGFTNPPTHKHTTTLNSTCADDGVVIGRVSCWSRASNKLLFCQATAWSNFVTVCTTGSRPANQFRPYIAADGDLQIFGCCFAPEANKKIEGLPSLPIRRDADLVAEVLFEAKQILQFWQLSNLGSSSWTSSGNVITSLLSRLLRCLTLFFNYRLPWFSGSRYFNLP